MLLLLSIAAFIYEYVYKLYSTINFYKAQGITILPGATRPLIGNVADIAKFNKALAENNKEPLGNFLKWLLENLLEPENKNGYKSENYKAVLWNRFGKPVLSVTDP